MDRPLPDDPDYYGAYQPQPPSNPNAPLPDYTSIRLAQMNKWDQLPAPDPPSPWNKVKLALWGLLIAVLVAGIVVLAVIMSNQSSSSSSSNNTAGGATPPTPPGVSPSPKPVPSPSPKPNQPPDIPHLPAPPTNVPTTAPFTPPSGKKEDIHLFLFLHANHLFTNSFVI